jgi:parallel beta-helix repeat protein
MSGTRQMHRNLVFIILAAFAVVAAQAHAVDYYVSTSGDDLDNGSESAPWRTLQKAANTVQAGDHVHVAAGTYAGFYITRDGTSSNPIVFTADNGVIVNSQNSMTTDNINIEGGDYVIIDGFTVENAPRIGIRIVTARGVIISNNTVANSGKTGIFTGYTPEIQIINNVSYNAGEQHAIYVSNSDDPNDNPVIRGNECYGSTQNGIQINGDCWENGDGIISGALVEDNIVHDNNWKGFSLISMQNSIVRNNVVYDNGISAGAGGIHIVDQPNCNLPSNNNIVANNTVVEPRIACIRINDGSVGNIIFNNLIVGSDNDHTIVDEVGGNYIDSASNLVRTSSSGLFTNAAGKDFTLAPGSAAIDAGTSMYQSAAAPTRDADGKMRPLGNGYDAGAYETGEQVEDTTPPTVSIIEPQNNETCTESITVTATAGDNVAVAGVQFRIDGANYGAEDTQPPYQITMNTLPMPNGICILDAVARDPSGNSTTSPGVSVLIDNDEPPEGIIPSHPRFFMNPQRLADLRAAACRDANGNVIPGCTPTPQWQRFTTWMDICIADPSDCYLTNEWHYALRYLITGEMNFANRAISMLEAEIADGLGDHGSDERKGYYLYARDFIRDAAAVYDWLYDLLTPQQRASFIDYMNRIVQEIYVEDEYDNPFYSHDRWAVDNDGNNYYYAFLLGAAYTAVATYGENDFTVPLNGNDVPLELYFKKTNTIYTDMLEFVYARYDQEAIPDWIIAHEDGGGWHEGEAYGIAGKHRMFQAFTLLKLAGGRNYFEELDFPRESVHYLLHDVVPGNYGFDPGGDSGRDKSNKLNPYFRRVALLQAVGLEGTVEGQYIQFWLNHIYPEMEPGWSFEKPWDFLLYDHRRPERNWTPDLPLYYHAQGYDWINSRSSWADDAVSVSFISADRIQDHQHKDQNSFVIYRGSGSGGWLAIDANRCSGSNGLSKDTRVHNSILVNNEGQRYGYGTGDIIKFEAGNNYTYVVGDASDAYYTDPGGWGHGKDKMLSIFQRELVHIFPGYVVVFDRITPTSQFQNATITYLLNTYYQPVINGNLVKASNDGSDLYQQTLLPVDYTMSTQSEYGCYRVTLRPQAPQANTFFLNVLYAGPTGITMPPTELVRSSTDNMWGARIADGSGDIVVMFSADPAGGVPEGSIIIEMSSLLPNKVFLFGLQPHLGYDVQVASEDGKQIITVTPGGERISSDQGMLCFNTQYDFPHPPKALASR